MNHLRLAAVFLLLGAASALGQGTPQQIPPGSEAPTPTPPVFRSGLDLVRLDVRVTDGEGRPLADLRPDEVQIRDEGTPRPIVLFQHIEAPRGTYAEAAQRTIAAQVSTNQGTPRGHMYVFVFDESHILPGHEQRARLAAERFLRAHVRPGDRVALYALPGPGPQIGFTADIMRLIPQLRAIRGAAEQTGTGALTALAPMRTYEAYEIARGNPQILDRLVTEVSDKLEGSDTLSHTRNGGGAAQLYDDPVENRRVLLEDARAMVARADTETRRFLMGFADVIRTLRAVDGRKTVILFSEGFQIDNVTHELEDVAAAAAQSYSAIYAMDLNVRSVEADATAPRGGEQSSEIRDKLQSLGSFTAETAGALVVDASAHLDQALTQLAETTEDYYLVGFTPGDSNEGDRNRYRHIGVSVTRPGARVTARTGYALTPRSTPADRRRSIDDALRAPFAQEGLKVEYTTYTLRGTAVGLQRVIVSLAADVPPAAVGADAAEVVYVVRHADTGQVAASGTDRLTFSEVPEDSRSTTRTGFYRVHFELPAGSYLMRAVVREPGGLLGSADRRFEVRALTGPDVRASDLVLGSSDVNGLPVRATAYASDVLAGVFELYGRTAPQLEGVTVTSALIPVGGEAATLSARGELLGITPLDEGMSRGARVELPLAGVTPGEYLVQVVVRKGDDTVTELLRDVTVRGGTRPPVIAAAARPARFEPTDVLQGEVGGRLLTAIYARAHGTKIEEAARAAASRNWSAVDAALASTSSGLADGSALRGIAAFARADYATAISAFRDAQTAGANDPALAFVLGWAHAASGDDRAAVTAWRSAILSDPALVSSYLALIDAYLRLGQPDLALQVVTSGLRALPASPELANRLAQLQRQM
jgi:VWFA-related protein